MERSYTFKEICEKTGYRPSAIRYYEKEFDLKIERDINGRRIFKEKDLNLLLFIKKYQNNGYSNQQIKKMINSTDSFINEEIAATSIGTNEIISQTNQPSNEVLLIFEQKFKEINELLNQLNQNISSKERDLLITENMKLKMELKQKSYEIMELKEKLRYERERKKGFFSRIFKKKS
ncbi:MAG: MerR family transcriptional regulator [Caloramator sp.]|nr:MerR family transcriptional regulator [Caloramator sp.]